MQPTQPKQFLEWTFQHRWCGMYFAWICGDFFLYMLLTLALMPVVQWLLSPIPRPTETIITVFYVVIFCFILLGLIGLSIMLLAPY